MIMHALLWFVHLFNFRHHARTLMALRYARATAEKRSPHWPSVRKKHLEEHATCAACGGKKKLQVHHIQPFHSHPQLELEPSNLITLCEAAGKDDHIVYGHGDSFHYWNPNVVADAARVLADPSHRRAVAAMAKARRLVNEPGGS